MKFQKTNHTNGHMKHNLSMWTDLQTWMSHKNSKPVTKITGQAVSSDQCRIKRFRKSQRLISQNSPER